MVSNASYGTNSGIESFSKVVLANSPAKTRSAHLRTSQASAQRDLSSPTKAAAASHNPSNKQASLPYSWPHESRWCRARPETSGGFAGAMAAEPRDGRQRRRVAGLRAPVSAVALAFPARNAWRSLAPPTRLEQGDGHFDLE